MSQNAGNDTPKLLEYSGPSTPRAATYVGLGVASLALSVFFFAGAAYLVSGIFQHYTEVSAQTPADAAEAAALKQQAKQMDAAALAVAQRPPHRALAPAEADAAIAYLNTM